VWDQLDWKSHDRSQVTSYHLFSWLWITSKYIAAVYSAGTPPIGSRKCCSWRDFAAPWKMYGRTSEWRRVCWMVSRLTCWSRPPFFWGPCELIHWQAVKGRAPGWLLKFLWDHATFSMLVRGNNSMGTVQGENPTRISCTSCEILERWRTIVHEQWIQKPACLGYIGDEILPPFPAAQCITYLHFSNLVAKWR